LRSSKLFLSMIIDVQPGWVSRTERMLREKGFKTRLTPPSTINAFKTYESVSPDDIAADVRGALESARSWRAACLEYWLVIEAQCPCPNRKACFEKVGETVLHVYCGGKNRVSLRVVNARSPPSDPSSIPRSVLKLCVEPEGLQDSMGKVLNIVKTLSSLK